MCAAAAGAHVVYGAKTLRGLVAEADLVVRARIVGPAAPAAGARPALEAEVLEVLKGQHPGSRVRFVQHGHGVAPFEPGAEAMLFLLDVARSRELDALGATGAADWVSLQEHDEAYRLEPATQEAVLGAVRAYAGAPAARPDALRAATLGLLRSGDPRLAASALRDLVLAPDLPLLRAEDLAVLGPVLDDPHASMGVRVGLLAELERRGLVDAPPRWLRLLSAEEPPADRVTAIRAAAASRDARVRARLVELLEDADERVAAAAAWSLDADAGPAEASALAKALSHPSASVRFSAIRTLGRSHSPAASRALEGAARSHPDADTRRRAAAELRKR